VFHANKEPPNAHLAHLQAPTLRLMLKLAKEPNFCQRFGFDGKKILNEIIDYR